MARERLDVLLVQRGLCPSREQAKRLILAGEVRVKGELMTKHGTLVPEDTEIVLREPPRFVSRGGLKLEGALIHFGIDVTGRIGIDIGSSTGGFTDCLLQRGAARVYAFDVGTNQLVWKLRNDPRVISREQFNVRHMQPGDLAERPDVLVADVSFISLTLVLPPVFPLLNPGADAMVLVKPQFELQREDIGKGGIVRDAALHQRACDKIEQFIRAQPDLEWRGMVESSIQGTDGNREFLAWFRKRVSE